ncbi:MAG: flagellar hook-length control protein FliK [Lachnospiraceae bacterium]|nr:flagellar hook-length control protein FliK [Lachnospiraceae bacterium]
MTSNQVTNSFGLQMATRMSSPQVTAKTDKTDFQSFMSNSEKKLENAEVKTSDAKTASKEEKAVKDEKPEKADKVVTNEKTEKAEPVKETKQPKEEEIDAVTEAVKAIVKAIEEVLGVTEEQLTEALENLGFDMMALLVPENITEVAVEVTGEDSVISLVTNEDLYSKVTELTDKVEETVTDLSKEVNIDPKEFIEAVKASENTAVPEMTIEPEKETDVKMPAITERTFVKEDKPALNDKNLEDKVEIITGNSEDAKAKSFVLTNEAKNETKEEFTSTESETFTKEAEPEIRETPVSFVQNLIDQTKEALNAAPEATVSYTETDARAIMEQMTESIKVLVDAQNTEVSLRLHPESLGNVNVRITAGNEGTLTAQFTAENEAVKAVLESQAIVLKETLEAKGMTIEAVEVMVQSHEFNEDLSNRGERSGQQGSRKNSSRRIDLSALEESEELSPEDNLQKEMMIQNGNTIDYTA